MQAALVIFSLLLVLSRASQAQQAVVGADSNNGEIRSFAAYANPSFSAANAIALQGAKVTYSAATGPNAGYGTAGIDAARFAFTTPALSGAALAFYLGVLDITGSVAWASTLGGTQTSAIGSISGVGGEVVASLQKIVVWQENNNQPGLQFDLSDISTIYGPCTAGSGVDCIDNAASLDLQANLTWDSISWNTQSCPTGSSYSANCTVYTLGTNGYYNSIKTITFTFVIASQNVMYNGQEIGPDKCKIDVDISFPWSSVTTSLTSPSVALYAGAAGRVAAGSAAGVVTANAAGSSATGSASFASTRTCRFTWVPTASVDGNSQGVYATYLTETEILNYPCTGCNVVSLLVVSALKLYATGWKVAGWDGALFLFSWTPVKPTLINWDPAVDDGVTTGSSGAFSAAPSFTPILLAILLLALFYKRWQ